MAEIPIDDIPAADDSQIELLSAIRTGPGAGLAAEAIANGEAAVAQRKLTIAAGFCVIFMVLEAVGGYFANSLAIMTDAAHLLADLAGFLISVFALWLSSRPATEHLSFGWYRMEIIGALMSVVLIWIVTGFLFVEAFFRIQNPEPVNGKMMASLAGCGLVVNAVIALVLHSSGHSHSHAHSHSSGPSSTGEHSHDGHSHTEPLLGVHSHQNVNVRAALIHAIGDLVQSLGVLIAAFVVWWHPTWTIVDPICTFFFGLIVLFSTTGLLKECIHVLMEGAPVHISNRSVRESLKKIEYVRQVHDLHIWSIKQGRTSLSVHLEVDRIGHHEAVLQSAQRVLREQFGISHSTIQIEASGDDCHSDCA
ncbi:unnamed protein product (mitochondrion) [Plasmodiophora brassicae]|uniref:Cation efflux protein cytoplasmic domain-containing protein n=1 Tax=Plasmodiophora brassicae TaxID=37360 RepID=A0A0G4IZQ3_PLABS|nr:hypothetical protein PBRA_001766 [Plasmodiophora brassicae]SPQ93804.1 unnamed protein product [Plasmodiophora brassicae]